MNDKNALIIIELAVFFGGPVLVLLWVTWSERRAKSREAAERTTGEKGPPPRDV